MDNLSGKASDWIPKESKTEVVEEKIDTIQREKDIKHLYSEIKVKSKQLEDKLKLLYNMEKTKETYDKLTSMSSLQNN
jgi:hypothetical protein